MLLLMIASVFWDDVIIGYFFDNSSFYDVGLMPELHWA